MKTKERNKITSTKDSIAIIGMAGRFPGAKNLNEFWENLINGKDTISHFSENELLNAGIEESLIKNPYYVKHAGVLNDIEKFDADFFGITPYEASITDPQHRIFLETCSEALETSGYIKQRNNLCIGVFAGMSDSTYLQNCLLKNEDFLKSQNAYQTHIATSGNFLATKISYYLNLTGPSINIHTACSTSLVTVIKACQSLLAGECNLALAGGISIRIPQICGHLYQEGNILSKDGKCRPFDKEATGTVRSAGVGVVVLKRLDDALSDNDCIDAIIKSYALNNDGAKKVSFTAPSELEQSQCITTALTNVDVNSIQYIEAHGTGTVLGDPIEFSALTKAFRNYTSQKNYCALGSVKANIGHADTAAGIAGLIKTVLIIKNKMIPPAIYFEEPNPHINLSDSPFYINKNSISLKKNNALMLAGVSSFGIGGTNAHILLQEPPNPKKIPTDKTENYHILPLSAHSQHALHTLKKELYKYLQRKNEKEEKNLSNIAFTLQNKRENFNQRYVFVCKNIKEASSHIKNNVGFNANIEESKNNHEKPIIVFLFPGQGSQYTEMGKSLYKNNQAFKQSMDQCCELLKSYLKIDLRKILFPNSNYKKKANYLLKQTQFIQPALFCIEYSLTKLYSSLGIQPQIVMGHSFGEIVAAQVAGILSLEDALKLICIRSKLSSHLPSGSMLAIHASVDKITPFLLDSLSIASINSPHACVISGRNKEIEKLKNLLSQKSILFQDLQINHAFHSADIDNIISKFSNETKEITLHEPKIHIISNVTGQWLTTEQLHKNDYWSHQLRHTVQFSAGINTILNTFSNVIFLECGPGHTLTNWVKQHEPSEKTCKTITSMPSATAEFEKAEEEKNNKIIYEALAKVWLYGIDINWTSFYSFPTKQATALPTYPFNKKTYWITQNKNFSQANITLNSETTLSKCFYQPSWVRLESLDSIDAQKNFEFKNTIWIILASHNTLSKNFIQRLQSLNQNIYCLYLGKHFKKITQKKYSVNPQQSKKFASLLKSILEKNDHKTCQVIHFWGLNKKNNINNNEISLYLHIGLYTITHLIKTFISVNSKNKLKILYIDNNFQSVFSNEICHPIKSTILGACETTSLEHNNIQITTLDLTGSRINLPKTQIITNLINECIYDSNNIDSKHLAYRNGYKWKKIYSHIKPVILSTNESFSFFKKNNVYIITGGLGGIGLSLTNHLIANTSAHIALISRTILPSPSKWNEWINNHTEKDPHYAVIKRLQPLISKGASISIWSADISNYEEMKNVINSIEKTVGHICGIIHAAGLAATGLIEKENIEDMNKILRPKIFGTYVLSHLFKKKPIDFVILFSSLTSITGGIGQFDYCVANAFLDAVPHSNFFHAKTLVNTINWNGWAEGGMNKKTITKIQYNVQRVNEHNTLTTAEGLECLTFSLKKKLKNLIISRIAPEKLIEYKQAYNPLNFIKTEKKLSKQTEKNTLEEEIISIFKDILGLKKIRAHDDFFNLGGDSLSALKLITAIEQKYNFHLSLNQLYEIRTPFQLIHLLKTNSYKWLESPLILLTPGSDTSFNTPPLFLIHPVGGTVFCYITLANQLKDYQSVYAIQDPGLLQSDYEFETLKEMANFYLSKIKEIQQHGPYYLGGYSMGGTIAFEIAAQLLQQGEKIAFLGLFDSWATFTPQFHKRKFFEKKMFNHIENTETKLKDFLGSDINNWLTRQWKRMQLLLHYTPPRLNCKITLFKATRLLPEYIPIEDTYNHWEPYSTHPLDIFYVSGTHDTLFSDKNIKKLKKNLIECLKTKRSIIINHKVRNNEIQE